MKCIETHEQQNSEKNLPFVSQTPLKLQKWTAFSSLSFLISWYLEGKEYCSILKSTFSFLAGKADGNVMKTCVLHINERLIEGNSQEERFVVVFRLLSFNSFFKNKNNNKKTKQNWPKILFRLYMKWLSLCLNFLSDWFYFFIFFRFQRGVTRRSSTHPKFAVNVTDCRLNRFDSITKRAYHVHFQTDFCNNSLVLLKEKITSNRALSVVWFRNLFHRHSRSWKWTSRRKLEIWRRTCWILYQVFH